MGTKRAGRDRRFPKPQVTGSNPVGVTEPPSGAEASVFGEAARARAGLIRTLTRGGLSRNRVAALVCRMDEAVDLMAQVERDAVREMIRGWAP